MRANDLALFLSPLSWVNEYDDANVLSAISALRRLSARPLSLRCCHTAFAFAPLRRSQRDRETMGGPRPGEARMATRCPRHFNTAIGSRPLSSLRSWHVSVLVLLSVGCSLTLTSVLPNCASLTSEGTRACACSFYGSRAACYNVRVRRPPAALPRCLAAYRHARRSRVRRSFATTLKVSHQPRSLATRGHCRAASRWCSDQAIRGGAPLPNRYVCQSSAAPSKLRPFELLRLWKRH